jgi:NHL repeat-containing protein
MTPGPIVRALIFVAALSLLAGVGLAVAAERLVFDAFIGTQLTGLGPSSPPDYTAPTAIAIDSRGFVYIADPPNDRVLFYDFISPTPVALTTLTNSSGGSVALDGPIGVAVDPRNDDVWIANTRKFQIVKIDKQHNLLLTIGVRGHGNSNFEGAAFVAVDPAGNLYVGDDGGFSIFGDVTDSNAMRVQKFRSDGTFVRTWGSSCNLGDPIATGCDTSAPGAASTGDGQFGLIKGLAVDGNSNVYVSDTNHRIQKFDRDGTFLLKWGSLGSGNGTFTFPRGIAVDVDDNVYVVDGGNDRIQKFTSTGVFLAKEGSPQPTPLPPGAPGIGTFLSPFSIAAQPKKNVDLCTLLGGTRCRKILVGEGAIIGDTSKRVMQMDPIDDADNDGLLAEVDVTAAASSVDFANGPTIGTVTGGSPDFVISAPTPRSGTPRPLSRPPVATDTVRITTGWSQTSATTIDWDCASSAVDILSSSTIQVHCSTPALDVLTGEAKLDFTGADGTPATAFLIAGDGIQLLAGTSAIHATSGEPIIQIGGNNVPLPPGQSAFADLTAPTTMATGTPGPNGNGWNKTSVSVALNATDNAGGSGVKEIQYALAGVHVGGATVAGATATIPLSAEGLTTVTYFARDNAGNEETPKTLQVRIDKTPPTFAGLPRDCVLWPPNHQLVEVASVIASDAVSGLASASVLTAHSSDPATTPGDATAPDIVINGSSVKLRAERGGGGAGRIYTLTVTAQDLAGNQATATATCTVPHDLRR